MEDMGLLVKLEPTDLAALRGQSESWANVPFSEGAFAIWEFSPGGQATYQLLCKPQGRLYFAGEHASRITAWMAGAIESARYVVKEIVTVAQQPKAL